MAEKVPQTLANHARLDPLYHFVMAPLALVLLVWTVLNMIRHPSTQAAILLGLAVLGLLLVAKVRTYALKVQDRVIRLEEQLRLQGLVASGAVLPDLTVGQWVGLRFACDEELTSLAEKAADGKLTSKQIKQAIQTWRPDYFRV